MPDVRRRHRDVLGEAPVAVDADDARVRTDVRIAGATEQAATIDDVSFGRDAITLLHIGDEIADLYDFAREFVADDEGRLAAALRPGIPFVDVYVGAADTSAANA